MTEPTDVKTKHKVKCCAQVKVQFVISKLTRLQKSQKKIEKKSKTKTKEKNIERMTLLCTYIHDFHI